MSNPAFTSADLRAYKKRSHSQEVWRNYKKSPSAMIGLVIIIAIVIAAIVSQFVFNYDTDIVQQDLMNRFLPPLTEGHLLGTDQYGRDELTRVLYGAKYSLAVGIVSVAISCLFGCTMGLIAGYYGGVVENIILRFCEVFMGIPSVLLGVAIMTAFGQSLAVLMLAVGLVYVPMFARSARAAVLPVPEVEDIEAAKGVANGILSASFLSFLGLGVPVPAPEWGAMLSSAREFIRDYGYLCTFPGIAIMVTVLSFNLMGDGLRDALDPKLKQ